MPTGQQIIDRALRLVGAIASGKSPTAQESTDALAVLNAMVEAWRLDGLLAYAHQTEQLTLIPAQSTYTIGPSGNLNTVRPIKVELAYLRVDGQDVPVSVFSDRAWAALPSKTEGGTPECLYYEGTMPQGTLQCYPVPETADTLHLVTWVPLTAFALTVDLALPPGYTRALQYNLAIELSSEYGQTVPPSVALIANDSLAGLRRGNQRPIEAVSDLYALVQG